MLNGVGPQRAMHERVTHVLYLTRITNGTDVQVLSFDDLADRLRMAQVHHTTHEHKGQTYISISCPTLPRNYHCDQATGAFFAMKGTTETEAKDSVVEFCKQCAISSPQASTKEGSNIQ
jgi:hypothetical protein